MSRTRRERKRGRPRAEPGWRSRSWMLWAGLTVVVVVILAGISSARSGAGGEASDFRLVAYQGQEIIGGSEGEEVDFMQVFRHGKPVVLNFWAGLCPPCRAEMPGFQRVYDDLGDDYVMLGVDIGPFVGLGSHDDARGFMREFGIGYPTAYSVSADPVSDYSVQGMPTTVFLTPDGQVSYRKVGFLPEDQLRSKLQDLLAASRS